MQIRHVVGLMLLLAAVPLQMYLTKYSKDFRDLVSTIVSNLPQVSINVTGYVRATTNYLQNIYKYIASSSIPFEDVNTPVEDQQVSENLIHNFRPPHLIFKIGDVILTRFLNVGIIVGWNIDMTDLSKEPVYLILAEGHDEIIKEYQDKMILLENTEISHDKIDQHFESYDGTRYIPKEALKKMYPKD